MFFYVFIDPEIITKASESGEIGLGHLINFLREHRYDCIFSETDNWRWGEELKANIKDIPHQHERKILSELVIAISTNGPFVLIEGDDGVMPLLELAELKAEECEIDLILTPGPTSVDGDAKWEACDVERLYSTRFENTRQQYRPCVVKKPGQDNAHGIWDTYFRKLLHHAGAIQLVDYSIGKYFAVGHRENLRKWLLWLNTSLRNPVAVSLKIHTYDNAKDRLDEFLAPLRNQVRFRIEMIYYPESEDFPHERFLNAETKWLQIGRGIDLFDRNEDSRDIMFAISSRPANVS